MRGTKKVFITRLTDVDLTDKEGVGSVRQDGEKRYKYVQLKNITATVACAAGTLVGYLAATGHPTHKVVADLSDADAVPICAGVTLAVIAGVLGTAYYCWIQTQGSTTLDTAVTSGSAGKGFTLTTTDKTGTVAVSGDTAPYAGISLNGTTSVLLTCPS